MSTDQNDLVVSSAHLADGSFPEVSEFEFGLILVSHGFERWMVRAMAAAGMPDMSPLEVLVLHTFHHRERAKKLADICMVLNIEDTHTVNYAVKKLIRAGLAKDGRIGKEKTVEATEEGAALCEKYRQIRERLLLDALNELGIDPGQMRKLSALMRLISGQYDQSARAATTY
ncbi:MAG: winged helix DNA-binding protein [Litoreibacter sp.]|nr:winged helix DNA-binding protein [Litoreibacter sp.]